MGRSVVREPTVDGHDYISIPAPGHPDRKRILNVLAQRRYRRRRTARLADLEAKVRDTRSPSSNSATDNTGPGDIPKVSQVESVLTQNCWDFLPFPGTNLPPYQAPLTNALDVSFNPPAWSTSTTTVQFENTGMTARQSDVLESHQIPSIQSPPDFTYVHPSYFQTCVPSDPTDGNTAVTSIEPLAPEVLATSMKVDMDIDYSGCIISDTTHTQYTNLPASHLWHSSLITGADPASNNRISSSTARHFQAQPTSVGVAVLSTSGVELSQIANPYTFSVDWECPVTAFNDDIDPMSTNTTVPYMNSPPVEVLTNRDIRRNSGSDRTASSSQVQASDSNHPFVRGLICAFHNILVCKRRDMGKEGNNIASSPHYYTREDIMWALHALKGTGKLLAVQNRFSGQNIVPCFPPSPPNEQISNGSCSSSTMSLSPPTLSLPLSMDWSAAKLIRVGLTMADKLGVLSDIMDPTSQIINRSRISSQDEESSPDNATSSMSLIRTIFVDKDAVPRTFLPTDVQQTIPHHPIIGLLPWPSVRMRLIIAFDLPNYMRPLSAKLPRGIKKLICCIDNPHSGFRIHGSSGSNADDWEIGDAFVRHWWWALDQNDLRATNRWRRNRGQTPYNLQEIKQKYESREERR